MFNVSEFAVKLSALICFATALASARTRFKATAKMHL
jgi:hypothetical protein